MHSRALVGVVFSLGFSAFLAGCATEGGSSQGIPNPFAGSARFEPKTTGSIGQQPAENQIAADVLPVEPQSAKSSISAEPLAAPSVASSAVQSAPATQGQSVAVASVQPQKNSASTGLSVAPIVNSSGYWTAEGGSLIVVSNGETVKSLSDRYGVPEAAIRAANKLSSKANPAPGAKLIIPVYNDGQSHAGNLKSGKAEAAPIVILPKTSDVKKIEAKTEKSTQVASTAKVDAKVSSDGAQSSSIASTEAPVTDGSVSAPKPTIEAIGFRWPAKGRVIAGFGSSNGVKNTGIKIALPVGTSVKASEAGTVAYSGSEVKGYGNMVIIRHADGWVSVYANNGDLKVKRGDQVSRGQVIAFSGQSGDVSSPQLHFELRKGSAPVDPMAYFSDN